jgi:hypothetical protein
VVTDGCRLANGGQQRFGISVGHLEVLTNVRLDVAEGRDRQCWYAAGAFAARELYDRSHELLNERLVSAQLVTTVRYRADWCLKCSLRVIAKP